MNGGVRRCERGRYDQHMDSTIYTFLFLGIIALFVILAIRQTNRQRALDTADGVTAAFSTFRLTATELIDRKDGTHYPLRGAVARVEDSGTVNRRITATRVLALGVFAAAAPKKLDDRELYFSIESSGYAVVRAIPLKNTNGLGARGREFAMKVNAVARSLEQPPVDHV